MAQSDHPHITLTPRPVANRADVWGDNQVYFSIRVRGLNAERGNEFTLRDGNYFGTELLKELHVAIGEVLAQRSHAQAQ